MIDVWSVNDTDDNMPAEILTRLVSQMSAHPWWQARTSLLLKLLGRHGISPGARILEAGCGWGTNLVALERAGYEVTGLDISRGMLEMLDSPNRCLIQADLTQPLPEDFKPYDAVVAMDVIEHIDDDKQAVQTLAKLCRPGGLILVSVPALPELWSEFDEIQGHRRRYLPQTLENAFEGSGLNKLSRFWWGGWMVPILRVQRRLDRARRPEGLTDWELYSYYSRVPGFLGRQLMKLFFFFDHHWAPLGLNPFGTSLLMLAQKPDK